MIDFGGLTSLIQDPHFPSLDSDPRSPDSKCPRSIHEMSYKAGGVSRPHLASPPPDAYLVENGSLAQHTPPPTGQSEGLRESGCDMAQPSTAVDGSKKRDGLAQEQALVVLRRWDQNLRWQRHTIGDDVQNGVEKGIYGDATAQEWNPVGNVRHTRD